MVARKPAADKVEKLSSNDAVDTILKYLRKQNRPYSATDISANLHNQVTKTAAAKLLKDLHEKGEIAGKASGKQLVYHALQDPTVAPSPVDLEATVTSTQRLTTLTATLNAELKTLRATLSALADAPSLSSLQTHIAALQGERDALLARATPLREGTVRPAGREERERAVGMEKKVERAQRARKGVERELVAMVRDVLAGEGRVDEGVLAKVMEGFGLNPDGSERI